MICRSCREPLHPDDVVCDLGTLPLANALLTEQQLDHAEVHYPHRLLICRKCLLVQFLNPPDADVIFDDGYPFFSGQAVSWLAHCRRFADEAKERFRLGATSRVLDIGSNDGTMLRRFRGLGIPAIGVEPCGGVAQHALMEGLPTIHGWWNAAMAERLLHTPGEPTGKGWQADLVIASNVLAHVRDLGDFLWPVNRILAPGGVAVFEVADAGRMIAEGQFDQIYAEHHSYFTVTSLVNALELAGMHAIDVERISTHGGSIRVYAQTNEVNYGQATVRGALNDEMHRGLHRPETYFRFAGEAPVFKVEFLRTLMGHAARGPIVGYGAPAKATTLLNYCGVGPELVQVIGDTTHAKWHHYLPGARIPIVPPERLVDYDPATVLLLAWNWAEEAIPKIRELLPDVEIIAPHPVTYVEAAA